jgi:hypothetical protein
MKMGSCKYAANVMVNLVREILSSTEQELKIDEAQGPLREMGRIYLGCGWVRGLKSAWRREQLGRHCEYKVLISL